jgi:flagellar biosynthetic protein FliR
LLAFHAVLVFARLGAAVMLLPGLGEVEIPAMLRLALGLGLVFALLPVVAPGLPLMPDQPGPLARLVAVEVVLGLWFGLLTRVLAIALAQAGQVMSLMFGLASPLQGDVVLGGAATALARLMGMGTVALVLASGLHEVPLRALAASYSVLPVGELPTGAAASALAEMAEHSMALAMQLAGPFVLATMLFNGALGLLARLAPQSQVFVAATPVQVLGGFALLGLLLPMLLGFWGRGMEAGFLRLPGLG